MNSLHSIVDVEKVEKDISDWSNPIKALVDRFREQLEDRVLSLDFEWLEAVQNAAKDLLQKINDYINEQEKEFDEFKSAIDPLSKLFPGKFDITEYEIFHADTIRPFYYRKQDLEEVIEEIQQIIT